MSKELNKDAVKAIREHYNCQGEYPCREFAHCQFGKGCNTSYDCRECGADEFYEGYIRAIKDKEEQKYYCEYEATHWFPLVDVMGKEET